MIVIDTSAFSKFLIKEENWKKVVFYLDPSLEPYSVDLLLIEAANVIWKYIGKYRLIARQQAFGLYEQMMKLVSGEVLVIEPSSKYIKNALKIAIEHNISVYDALFLAQAMTLNAKLITSDRLQSKIAEKIDVDVVCIE
ncbi:MAG: type II toxin-antitoxin system VapC family toxin [Archaeoglobaceae archaeon]|nr:type II toxin-antitoxin system VapC family toxin [Archaeoglobaceae archaeon]